MYVHWCTCMLHVVHAWMEWWGCDITPPSVGAVLRPWACLSISLYILSIHLTLVCCHPGAPGVPHPIPMLWASCSVTSEVLVCQNTWCGSPRSCEGIPQSFMLGTTPGLHHSPLIRLNIQDIHVMFVQPRFHPPPTPHYHLSWLALALRLVVLAEGSSPPCIVCLVRTQDGFALYEATPIGMSY